MEGEDDASIIGEGRKRAAIIRIDPALAEETLFRKLQQQVLEDDKTDDILEELSELRAGPEEVAAIVHLVMKQMTGPLLGYIVPPQSGASIIKDRIVQIAVILLDILKEKVYRIETEIEKSLREGKEYEVRSKVRELIRIHNASLIAIREIMNRFLILYHLNLPSSYRPPLAQIKLGMDIITPQT